MRRKITHGRKAGEKLARRWLGEAGIPRHLVGFSDDAGFYLIIHCLSGGATHEFPVPCWSARVLRGTVNDVIREIHQTRDLCKSATTIRPRS